MSHVLDFAQMRKLVNSKASEMEKRFPLQKAGFLPWVGTLYDVSFPRLLILGESTYNDRNWCPREAERLSDEPIAICEVGRMLKAGLYERRNADGRLMRSTGNFMRNIVTYIRGDNSISGQDFATAWERWAFWELIQDRLDYATSQPTTPQWRRGWEAFEEIVQLLKPKPDLVVGLGYRMRDSLRMLRDRFPPVAGQENLYEYRPAALRMLFLIHPSYKRVRPAEQHKRFAAVRDGLAQGSRPASA